VEANKDGMFSMKFAYGLGKSRIVESHSRNGDQMMQYGGKIVGLRHCSKNEALYTDCKGLVMVRLL